MNSTLDLLSRNRLFVGLDKLAIGEIATRCQPISLAKDEALFLRGDDADGAYIVEAGEISIETISESGQIVRFATMASGDIFGELALIDGGSRTADARALSEARLLQIRKNDFRDLVRKHSRLFDLIAAEMVRKMRETNDQIEGIMFQKLSERLGHLLFKLASESDEETPRIKITQFELAERLSAAREKINGHLQHFREVGAIQIERGQITILDRRLLVQR